MTSRHGARNQGPKTSAKLAQNEPWGDRHGHDWRLAWDEAFGKMWVCETCGEIREERYG